MDPRVAVVVSGPVRRVQLRRSAFRNNLPLVSGYWARLHRPPFEHQLEPSIESRFDCGSRRERMCDGCVSQRCSGLHSLLCVGRRTATWHPIRAAANRGRVTTKDWKWMEKDWKCGVMT